MKKKKILPLTIIAGLGLITVIVISVALANYTRIPANIHNGAQIKGVTTGLPPCPSITATGCDKSKLLALGGSSGSMGCKGKGASLITASPIALSDLLYIQPMGLEIGGHVTPIDHGYFYIKNPNNPTPVYAPLDGIITSVSRTVRAGETTKSYDDYAITISATCTFRVRFSNMVKFSGNLGKQIGQLKGNDAKTPNYTVKAGELIGYTGLPTAYGIDVWVENDNATLTGFINPAQYATAESWKLHMVDLYEYTKEPLKSKLLKFAMRDASPRFGKIDYDQDGKLIGTWFKVGSRGYSGGKFGSFGNYWNGHLSIVPDGNDPTQTDVSFGNYQGEAKQFAVIGNKPNPANVTPTTGLVKYELGQIESYSGTTGQTWDHQTYLPHIRTRAKGPAQGTVLLQLTGKRSLKMEIFPNKTAEQISGFDSGASMYER